MGDDDRKYLCQKFSETSFLKKIICVLRTIEFGIKVEHCFKFWEISEIKYNFTYYSINEKDTLFMYERSTNDIYTTDELINIKYYNNNTFNINYLHYFTHFDCVELNINGSIFKYNDNYYCSNYQELYKIIYPPDYDIKNRFIIKNPFINSASKNLNDILPFLRGQVNEIKEYYDGKIIDNKYVKYNIYENKTDFSKNNLKNIKFDVLHYL